MARKKKRPHGKLGADIPMSKVIQIEGLMAYEIRHGTALYSDEFRRHRAWGAIRAMRKKEPKAAQDIPATKNPKPRTSPKQKPKVQPNDKFAAFYKSAEWKRARYDALKLSQGKCCLCGASPTDGVVLNVDHIKPLRKNWALRANLNNLQVLCGSCNWGKGNRDDTDWR